MALTTWKDDKFEYRRYATDTEGDKKGWLIFRMQPSFPNEMEWSPSSGTCVFRQNYIYARPLPPPLITPPVPPPEPPRPDFNEYDRQVRLIAEMADELEEIPCIRHKAEAINSLIGGIQTKMRETYPDHKFDNF